VSHAQGTDSLAWLLASNAAEWEQYQIVNILRLLSGVKAVVESIGDIGLIKTPLPITQHPRISTASLLVPDFYVTVRALAIAGRLPRISAASLLAPDLAWLG
jgi:hypothetical protein